MAPPVTRARGVIFQISNAPHQHSNVCLDYRSYKMSVPPFVLFFPALYRTLPRAVKCLFCCEFPLYWSSFPADGDRLVEAPVATRMSDDGLSIARDFDTAHKINAPTVASYQRGGV